MADPYTFGVGRAGLGNVASYQVSGIPYLTGSTAVMVGTGSSIPSDQQKAFFFPTVAKSVQIFSRATSPFLVHFAPSEQNNVIGGSHYITLAPSGSLSFTVKCKEIYVTAQSGSLVGGRFEIFAELTHIPTVEMYILSGTGITI